MRVRPLQWTSVRAPNRAHQRHHIKAPTPWGEYRIEWWGHESEAPFTQVCLYGPGNAVVGTGEMLINGYSDVETAKAAAYADHWARLDSVIARMEEVRDAA